MKTQRFWNRYGRAVRAITNAFNKFVKRTGGTVTQFIRRKK